MTLQPPCQARRSVCIVVPGAPPNAPQRWTLPPCVPKRPKRRSDCGECPHSPPGGERSAVCDRRLYDAVLFHDTFEVRTEPAGLTWSHHRALFEVTTEAGRAFYIDKVRQER